MATTKAERLQKIHAEALAEFDEIQTAVRAERLQCLEDRRFYSIAGAQWEGDPGAMFEAKPRFEFNRVHLAVIRIISEYRNNRVTVDFQPRDGTDDDEMADVCDGLYRADERTSSAEEAYDNAFEEAVGGGFGAWRLCAEKEDEDDDEDERQRVRIEPIFDADSTVFFDLGARRHDKRDARRAYVLTPYTPAAYETEFGDSPQSWDRAITAGEFDWATPDVVWVCEHYRLDERKEEIIVMRGLAGDEIELGEDEVQDAERLDSLQAQGYTEERRRKMRRKVVTKYVFSGGKVLAGPEIIAGRNIPIVPVYGKRWVVDGVERCCGHVRLAKDAQRLINMLMSWLAEMAGRFDIEKPILSPEQIAGHTQMWADDAIQRYPYLLSNLLRDANGDPIPSSQAPTAYTKAPNVPPAMAALSQIAGQALDDLLGNQQAGEQMQPNMSGKAVELIQNRLDMQTFIYMSNLAKAMRRSGEIWLSMMRDITTEEARRMKTVDAGGETGSAVLNEPAFDPEKGEYTKNDMTAASYEVDVDVGPSSSSRRAATVRAVTGMMQLTQDPEMLTALGGIALANMEGEGLADLRDWSRRRLVAAGIAKPTPEEAQELAAAAQGRQPSPQDQYMLAAAEEAQAGAEQSRAKTVETIASAELKRAQTMKTAAETQGEHSAQQLATLGALRDTLNQPPPTGVPLAINNQQQLQSE